MAEQTTPTTEEPLDKRILRVLGEAKKPLTPQEIAHQVGFAKPNNQAHRVNPTLYKLWEAGEIERETEEGGRKPRYTLRDPKEKTNDT